MKVILDAGHGGLVDGVYQTAGKRSPAWKDGKVLYEGEFNRAVVKGIVDELTKCGVQCVVVSHECLDNSLVDRVNRANKVGKDSIYISVHANAGGGKGWEVYTSIGQTKSDKLAEIFCEEYTKAFPDRKLRSDLEDGDRDREASFYVLNKTAMPAVLTENFFMDTEEECRAILMSPEGRKKVIDVHVKAIKRAINELK